MNANKPISEKAFRRVVRELSAEQLLKFPTESLPGNIPLDVIDPQQEPEKWAALEQLVWGATERDVAQRAGEVGQYGKAVSQAIDACESEDGKGTDELRRLCDRLAELCPHSDPTRDQLSEENQLLEQANDRAREIMQRIGRLTRALATIADACARTPESSDRLGSARLTGKQALEQLESALGRFHMLELDIASTQLKAKDAECALQRRHIQDLDQRIGLLKTELKKESASFVRVLKPTSKRKQCESIEARLDTLRRNRENAEVFVDEDLLLHWLEVLINTSLFTEQERWRERARNVRLLLYRLLNTYCVQQELAAEQVATRALPGINGRAAIGYYLRSEEFILGYFARKQREVTQWLGGAAESKLARLNHTRDALLNEYRRLVEEQDPSVDPGLPATG
ncbi:MAG: hypothetical protein U5K33_10310 [Halofilum sp. (in: g-proteobacteria)]|nr:hypothetical protein [Halofilum sp. (in: g-proteobacteria)]